MFNTPILFLTFNRPETTYKVWQVISKVQPTNLYIHADGARSDFSSDLIKCAKVRDIIQNIDWACNVNYLLQDKNLGCSSGPRTAIDWFFSNVEEGIILEDDCLPSIQFFTFCEILLKKYRYNSSILTINGSNLGYNFSGSYSYTFSRFMNMTGWATWKRCAVSIDYNLSHWNSVNYKLLFIYQILRQNILDFDINWYKYWIHKFNLTVNNNEVTWWDWQWIYYQLTNKKLSIVPSNNLVTNIGFNEDATHTTNIDDPASLIPTQLIDFPLGHPARIQVDYFYEENYVKKVWCGYNRLPNIFYFKKYIKLFFNKVIQNRFQY